MLSIARKSGLILLFIGFLFASCKNDPGVKTTISIDKPDRTILYISEGAADSVQLSATIKPSPVGYVASWSTHDPKVATVDSVTGMVTAKSIGKTKISVGVKAAIDAMTQGDSPADDPFGGGILDVKSDDSSGNSIEISVAARIDSFTGGTRSVSDFIPNVQIPDGGSLNPDVVCSNPDVLWVERDGSITVLKPDFVGTVTLSMPTSDGGRSEFDIELGRLVTGIRASASSLRLIAGIESAKVSVDVLPADASNKSFEWVSSDPRCVSVTPGNDNSATIKALEVPKNGQSIMVYAITKDGGYKAPISVTVDPVVRVEGVRLYVDSTGAEATSIGLDAGDSCKLRAEVYPSNATVKDCEWSVIATGADEAWNAIKVEDGLVTGLSLGKKARVRASAVDGGFSAYCTVNVQGDKITVGAGEIDPIVISADRATKLINGDALRYPVSYDVSDHSLASIDQEGNLNILNMERDMGKMFDVIITYNDDTVKRVPIIIGNEIPPEDIQSDSSEISMYVGVSMNIIENLNLKVNPSNVTIGGFSFRSTNEEVARVTEDGILTAVGDGDATIFVYSKRNKNVFKEITLTAKNPVIRLKVHNGTSWYDLEPVQTEVGLNFSDVLAGKSAANIEYGDVLWMFDAWTMLGMSESESSVNPSNLTGIGDLGRVIGDATLYAKYKPARVTIRYKCWSGDDNGGWQDYVTSENVSSGSVIVLPDPPQNVTYGGVIYSFHHWIVPDIPKALEESDSNPFRITYAGISTLQERAKGDIVAYAAYSPKIINVTYMYWKSDADGWAEFTQKSTYSSGNFDSTPKPGKVEHDGWTYTFLRWVVPSDVIATYPLTHDPSSEHDGDDVPSVLTDHLTVYAEYGLRLNINYKCWNGSGWSDYRTEVMTSQTVIPYPATVPRVDYSNRTYEVESWIYFTSSEFAEANYNPATDSLWVEQMGHVLVANDVRDDLTVYAKYRVLDAVIRYMVFDVAQNKWVVYENLPTKTGNYFEVPGTAPNGAVQNNTTYVVCGWTSDNLSAVTSLANATSNDLWETTDKVSLGFMDSDGVMVVYAVYQEIMDYPNLVEIPASGPFSMRLTMGDVEQEVTGLSLSRYYIADHEVTCGEWDKVYGAGESAFCKINNPSHSDYSPYVLANSSENLPVVLVSWDEAVKFCNDLSIACGVEPCYTLVNEVIGEKVVDYYKCDFSKNGYRLPTEIEWQYAAMGGGSTQAHDYSGSNDASKVAIYNKSGRYEVKGLQSNGFGLYDMTGNVAEWCYDWYEGEWYGINDESYAGKGKLNYSASDMTSTGQHKVYRGGSWFTTELNGLRLSERYTMGYGYCMNDVGFRVCRSNI